MWKVVEGTVGVPVAEALLAVVFCRKSGETETLGEMGGAEARA